MRTIPQDERFIKFTNLEHQKNTVTVVIMTITSDAIVKPRTVLQWCMSKRTAFEFFSKNAIKTLYSNLRSS